VKPLPSELDVELPVDEEDYLQPKGRGGGADGMKDEKRDYLELVEASGMLKSNKPTFLLSF